MGLEVEFGEPSIFRVDVMAWRERVERKEERPKAGPVLQRSGEDSARRGPGGQKRGLQARRSILCLMQPEVRQDSGELPIGFESLNVSLLGDLAGCLPDQRVLRRQRGTGRDGMSSKLIQGLCVRPTEEAE